MVAITYSVSVALYMALLLTKIYIGLFESVKVEFLFNKYDILQPRSRFTVTATPMLCAAVLELRIMQNSKSGRWYKHNTPVSLVRESY